MANLYTADFEAGTLAGFTAFGTCAASTTQAHNGTWSASFLANNAAANFIRRSTGTVAKGTRLFYGHWLWIPSNPTAIFRLSYLETTASGATAQIVISTGGVIQLQDNTNAVIVAGPNVTLNGWTNIEYSALVPVAGTTASLQLIVNGVDYGSGTGTVGSTAIGNSRLGQLATASTGITTGYLDDIAINDDTGATNNSWPSGFGSATAHNMALLGVGA